MFPTVPAPLEADDVTATSLQRTTEPVQPKLQLRSIRRPDGEFLPYREYVLHLQNPSN